MTTGVTVLFFAFIALSLSFSWDECKSGTTINVVAVAENPDPILLPGNLTLKASATTTITISDNTIANAALTLEKKELGVWIEIPCVDNVGSCNYPNPCDLLAQHQADICPTLKEAGLPCPCPIPAGQYSLPAGGLNIVLGNPGLSWLTDGDIYGKLALTDASGNTQLCLEVYATLKVA